MSSHALVQFAVIPTQFFDSVWQLNYIDSRSRKKPELGSHYQDHHHNYHHEPERVKPDVEIEEDYYLYELPVLYEEEQDDTGFALFILSEVLFGIIGFYLGAAVRNHNDWDWGRWDWESEATSTAATKGGLDGTVTPYAFFYSAEVIGIEATVVLAALGAYLGMSAQNRDWDPWSWDWTSPETYYGGFEGMQDCVWLVDDITEIEVFAEKARMREWEKAALFLASYIVGGLLSYWYIAQENEGNFQFWEWDYTSPVTIFGIVKGYHSGTRLPVGFGEIGLEILDAVERAEENPRPDEKRAFFYYFVVRNRWMWAGALWVGMIYASVENEAFDIAKWEISSFATLEAFLDGVMFGKDLQEMFVDVRKYFLGRGGDGVYVIL